ncbi:hypothetical protein MPTK1_6g04520 [Marchantia polymorpha subsp. ruderalis]|uniref:Uncharacterized protein n=2 Tax=Marchantia polymorpha TaxID=3197 RepID=A0AAF6BNH1_MARPO|nr:hypothetical protein MARPO_0034s0064 [Marchantia polymorpha]BBN13555.1 hypothetical protein Mp_6g04520 [Marchantia polymorpha subsp. ruderalis]|eukprot:PTQ41477.1 hypothetical protein MARPO_0034s0064 [Marchantia polymorpha]
MIFRLVSCETDINLLQLQVRPIRSAVCYLLGACLVAKVAVRSCLNFERSLLGLAWPLTPLEVLLITR